MAFGSFKSLSSSIMRMMNRFQKATIFTRLSILKSYFSHTPNATDSVNRAMNPKVVDLEIISKESIKPASPTPLHLRTSNLSIIDQYMINLYTPSLLFLPNTDNTCVSNVGNIRSRRLKESLSELLTLYYPFAGEIKDNLHVECNDKGVYFVEARVNQTLEEFLHEPDDHKVRELKSVHPSMSEGSSMNYVASVQVNIFNCGGIGLVTSISHKIVDGQSYFTFMKAWAAASSRGLSDAISPSFVSSEVFPYNLSLKDWFPSNLIPKKVVATKRFVFYSMALASLKSQLVSCNDKHRTRCPSRVEATTSLVWKAVAKAASSLKPFIPHSPHALLSFVNLRKKASPPFPNESIGNLIVKAIGICFPNKQPNLSTLMDEMRESISKVSLGYDVESLKGEKGQKALNEKLRTINDMLNVMEEGDCLFATSMMNGGMYEIDFGWGKPIWFYHMNPGSPGVVSLNDVLNGGGVEAVFSLSWEEMNIFERDPEILSYTTLNPSPLQFLD